MVPFLVFLYWFGSGFGLVWLGLGGFGWVWLGWVGFGCICLGLVSLGWVWLGLVGFGWVWLGLHFSTSQLKDFNEMLNFEWHMLKSLCEISFLEFQIVVNISLS